MALKKKKNVKEKNGKSSSSKNYFILTPDNKKQILGIFLLIISIILFLSVITFDRRDEANLSESYFSDFFTSFDTKIDIQNWLGVTGAHFSKFLVKATFGYFSVTIPIVLFLWGVSFFKKIDFKFRLHVSNFLLLSSIIFATFFGVLHENYGLFLSSYELSGFIGDHLGNFLSGLVGGIGGILILGFSFVTLLIFALDIDIKNILIFFRDVFSFKEDETEEDDIKAVDSVDPKEKENLDKIKKLSGEKKKKKEKTNSRRIISSRIDGKRS